MKRSHMLLFGANAFGIGFLAPVLSLIFLSRGAVMETLSLCIGIFAVTVVVLELPSGILADMIGRKRVFVMATLAMTSTYLLLLFSRHFLMLAAACAMQGIGRAFSSGSIEALEIESYMERNGSESLEKINSVMAIIDSIGLALGSIVGGILGFLDGTYTVLLAAAALLQIFILVMTVCFVREAKREKSPLSPLAQFKEQLRGMAGSLTHSRTIATVVFMTVAAGMLLCAVEVYWQPTLKLFLPESLGWIFGIVSCLGYAGVSIGSKLTELFIDRRKKRLSGGGDWRLYWQLRFFLLFSVAALGFVRRVLLFLLLFTLVYALLGAGNLIENTAFHASVPNGQRAGMMSLLSLSFRGGGFVTSLLGSAITVGLSFSAVWILVPAVTLALMGGILIFF